MSMFKNFCANTCMNTVDGGGMYYILEVQLRNYFKWYTTYAKANYGVLLPCMFGSSYTVYESNIYS